MWTMVRHTCPAATDDSAPAIPPTGTTKAIPQAGTAEAYAHLLPDQQLAAENAAAQRSAGTPARTARASLQSALHERGS